MTEMMAFLQSYGAVLALIGNVVVLLLASKFVTRDAHKVVADKLEKVEDRIAALETEFRHLPARADVHAIQIALAEMKGELMALGEKLKPVAGIADRLQDYMLEQAKR